MQTVFLYLHLNNSYDRLKRDILIVKLKKNQLCVIRWYLKSKNILYVKGSTLKFFQTIFKLKIIKNTINLNWFRQNNSFMLEEQFDIL